MRDGTGQRPLSELSPVAPRTNSPSWNQTSKMMMTPSPFDSSPLNSSSSSRLFWQGRDSGSSFQLMSVENRIPYDPGVSLSPSKRASIENLKRASRVKNSSMFAREQKHEYDPAHVRVLDRPLAVGRPFHTQENTGATAPVPNNQYGATEKKEITHTPPSPSKDQVSPAKSSLMKGGRFGGKSFDPEYEIWSDRDSGASPNRLSDHSQQRHSKSVTFDAAPPQINEYEMTTPDLSSIASESCEGSYDFDEDEDEFSFDRGSSLDRDDSFDASLEDIEKTPVVLPEDWRFMSPASVDRELEQGEDDPFGDAHSSSGPDILPPSKHDTGTREAQAESPDSNGERRPLPPLPSSSAQNSSVPNSPGRLSNAFERGGSQRDLPSPPSPASYSKAEISGASRGSMTLEDRLRLMMLQEQSPEYQQSEAERQRERRMRRAGARDKSSGHDTDDNCTGKGGSSPPAESRVSSQNVWSPPHISRESILWNIKNHDINLDESYEYSLQASASPNRLLHYDPDVPLPSLEDGADAAEDGVIIKEEHSDDEDIYAIPEYYGARSKQNAILNDDENSDYERGSHYSHDSGEAPDESGRFSTGSQDGQATPVPLVRDKEITRQSQATHCDVSSTTCGDIAAETPRELSPGLSENADNGPTTTLDMAGIRESLQRPTTPETQSQQSDEEPSTPESVIRHPVKEDPSTDEAVPDPIATIKAPGSDLKTRLSLTPAETQDMAAARRKVSSQNAAMLSPINSYRADPDCSTHSSILLGSQQEIAPEANSITDVTQRQSSLVKLDIPISTSDETLGFGLDKEFDRVIEAQKVAFELSLSKKFYPLISPFTQDVKSGQKYRAEFNSEQGFTPVDETVANANLLTQRGYLMRQNTRVIIASSRVDDDQQPSSGENGPDLSGSKADATSRKASQPTWTSEPWNPKTRRQSIKVAGGPVKKKPTAGAAPPLPGMPSNVQDVQLSVEENEAHGTNEPCEEEEERGRVFVKVIGVKDLDLPFPKGEQLYFSLTLDNGIHCVTTSWIELGRSASIGQEFELIVQNELEFQLTLQLKVEDAMFKQIQHSGIVSAPPPKQKSSTFSRVFASPRKRKELELRQQLEQQQKQKAEAHASAGPWVKLRTLVNRDGSFARAYVALSEHEKYAYGRPYSVQISCFNEWAVEESSSLKGKKATNGPQKLPPYKIGNLELQLLYVPKPKGVKDEDMPKSMNACIREMREAESTASRSWEGFLSQQGGDCPYWRRRFFRLQGSKLTAYHEVTRQPRATINLAKAAKLIDDKSTLTQKETSTKGGGRRKSAFAEEEEGYMFVEEGFRIRFANGEVIDFYADSRLEKEGWMKVLYETVGKGYVAGNGHIKPWTEVILRHERSLQSKREAADRLLGSAPSVPAPPKKDHPMPTISQAQAPLSPQRQPRHQHTLSQPDTRKHEARREKARSLIF